MLKPKLVPIKAMPAGQWFLWGYPTEPRPYRVVQTLAGEWFIMYPDGWLYRDLVDGDGIPIDGPDVDFEVAYREATRKPRVSELEPGTKFRIHGRTLMKLTRYEFDSVEEGVRNPVVVLERDDGLPIFTVDSYTSADPIVDEVL